jgi:hypothetical protein
VGNPTVAVGGMGEITCGFEVTLGDKPGLAPALHATTERSKSATK